MTPEEYRDAAKSAFKSDRGVELATYYATMAVAEALLQMDVCGHGTRGFCKDCFWVEFSNRQPFQTQETKSRY